MAYTLVRELHNLNRWFVLLAATVAVAMAWWGVAGRAVWARRDRAAGVAFVGFFDLQVALGLTLYVLSPFTRPGLTDPAAVMSNPAVRFFALDHPVAMLIAVAVAHATAASVRRAVSDRARFRRAAIGYTTAVVIVVASIPWPAFKYGRRLWPVLW